VSARIIDGRAIAEGIRAQIATEVTALHAAHNLRPGLAAVLVGENPASQTYVRMKRRACAEVGMESTLHELPATISQAELETLLEGLNAQPDVHGILLQLPLPPPLDERAALLRIAPHKDVDGLHPFNAGLLAQRGRTPLFVPATPAGVLRLLDALAVPLRGAEAVVIGRSALVGMPVALLLAGRDCTVTLCHSRTRDLPAVARRADVLVAAAGQAELVRGDWIKPGAVVIDVGTNAVADADAPNGRRLVGDVHFASAREVASAITPVPGGVGPMTIALLLENTLRAAQRTVNAASAH
jgi:5,10-methylene-tetrahydrofolate dehydrogenase/methenyl tetrahydrofolate cyclohydrolase